MSLEMAVNHREALNRAYAAHAHDPRWRWYHGAYSALEKELRKDTWDRVQMVSVRTASPRKPDLRNWTSRPKETELLGYLSATMNRATSVAEGLGIVRFGPSPSLEFGRDMARFLRLLFEHYAIRSLQWSVVVGSPHERGYDRLASSLGGRIVGVFSGDAVLTTGERHDRKFYELPAAGLDRDRLDRLTGETNGRAASNRSEAPGRERRDAPPGEGGADDPGEPRAGVGAGLLQPADGDAERGMGDGEERQRQDDSALNWIARGALRLVTLDELVAELIDRTKGRTDA